MSISPETFAEIERVSRQHAQPAPVRVAEVSYAHCSGCLGFEKYGRAAVRDDAAAHHQQTGHRVLVVTTVTEAYEAAT